MHLGSANHRYHNKKISKLHYTAMTTTFIFTQATGNLPPRSSQKPQEVVHAEHHNWPLFHFHPLELSWTTLTDLQRRSVKWRFVCITRKVYHPHFIDYNITGQSLFIISKLDTSYSERDERIYCSYLK